MEMILMMKPISGVPMIHLPESWTVPSGHRGTNNAEPITRNQIFQQRIEAAQANVMLFNLTKLCHVFWE